MSMLSALRRTVFFAVLALSISSDADAAERQALVVGMAEYRHIPRLRNTVNDARALSDTLMAIGFEVTTLIDAPQDDLVRALDDFAFRSETADLALIYFAGHGVEVQGENFLIPVDAAVRSNADIQQQSVSLTDMLAAVDHARKMRVVILDSCRDRPFQDLIVTEDAASADGSAGGGRGGGGGLAPATPDRGTLVAFAARDGQVALDGDGANSPFAQALVDNLAEPGLEISLMFRQVRDEVLAKTSNLQEPHTYGSLPGMPYYIAGAPEERAELAVDDLRIAWSALRGQQAEQLSLLADGGDTRAMMGLAYMRLNPNSDSFAPGEAARLLDRAVAGGAPEAMYELARLYEAGTGVPQNADKALALFERASGLGYADAINDLGFLHYQGGLGLRRDPHKALEFFSRAAELRHPQALFNYAALIDDGLVPGKGPDAAAGYLYQALRAGSSDVLDLLGQRPEMFTAQTRRALQAELSRHGFYSGALDGAFGPGTQAAIRTAYGLTQQED